MRRKTALKNASDAPAQAIIVGRFSKRPSFLGPFAARSARRTSILLFITSVTPPKDDFPRKCLVSMPRYSINFVSAPCGAGKSHGACRYIKENLCGKNFLYVAPSLRWRRCRARGGRVSVEHQFNSPSVPPGRVLNAIGDQDLRTIDSRPAYHEDSRGPPHNSIANNIRSFDL